MNYFDLHCDTPYKAFLSESPFAVRLEEYKWFNLWKQCFAFWIPDNCDVPYDFYRSAFENFSGYLAKLPANIIPILTVENGKLLGDDITLLDTLKNDGIKALTLTWNGENQIAGGVDSSARLKEFGKRVVKRLNELKIACDMSHLNDKSFFDVIEYAEHPIATHSCCREVCSHKRNLTDEQLKLLSERDGIIGVCLYPLFLGGDQPFDSIYRHISHMLELGLENNISIGTDFDGAKMSPKLCNTSQIPDLYEFLHFKNISSCTLDKIFYQNAENFFDNL